MDFREMLYITTVADCRSITAAARKLYISQPSLSHIVSKVEQDVGVKLFDRGTSPLTITYAGEKYVETARQQNLPLIFRQCVQRTGNLRLNTSCSRIQHLHGHRIFTL